MASNSDLTHQPPAFDASTLESANYSSPRPRHDSTALLMLPAPLSVNRQPMSSASSVGMSRSSEDNYNSDSGSNSNLRLIPSPQVTNESGHTDSSDQQRLLSPVSPHEARFSRQAPNPMADPFRSQTTSPTHYDDGMNFSPDYDGGRGVRLTDSGPVPGPDGVRRVPRPTGRRPTSQAPPQNRYSRSSAAFSLPPGAAPPQSHYGGN